MMNLYTRCLCEHLVCEAYEKCRKSTKMNFITAKLYLKKIRMTWKCGHRNSPFHFILFAVLFPSFILFYSFEDLYVLTLIVIR